MKPTKLSLGMVASCRARLRFAWRSYCSSAASNSLNFRIGRHALGMVNSRQLSDPSQRKQPKSLGTPSFRSNSGHTLAGGSAIRTPEMMAHNVNGQLRPINWALGPAFRVNPHYKSWYFSHILYGERFQPIPARNCCSVAFSGDNSDWLRRSLGLSIVI
jgi:hypothetical protein